MDRKRYCLRSSTNKCISIHREEIQINWQFPGLLIECLQFSKTNRTSCFILPKINRRILLKVRLRQVRDSLPFSRQGYLVRDSPANLYRDFMPTRMKLNKVLLSNFATLARSASKKKPMYFTNAGYSARVGQLCFTEMLQDRIQRANAF